MFFKWNSKLGDSHEHGVTGNLAENPSFSLVATTITGPAGVPRNTTRSPLANVCRALVKIMTSRSRGVPHTAIDDQCDDYEYPDHVLAP